MDYRYFSLEDIMNVHGYRELCQKFFDLAKDEETKSKLETILLKGKYENYFPGSPIGRNNPSIDIRRRISLAYVLVRNPDSFEKLIASNATFFHGTRSSAIPSILEHGLNSELKSTSDGIEVTTGEKSTSQYVKRNFVSFTDVLDIGEEYASLRDYSGKETFPVVFGTTLKHMEDAYYRPVGSDLPEVGVRNHFPVEYLNLMMVPPDKVAMFKGLVPEGIDVIGVDDIGTKFYYVDDVGAVTYDQKAYDALKDKLKKIDKKQNFFQRAISSLRNK